MIIDAPSLSGSIAEFNVNSTDLIDLNFLSDLSEITSDVTITYNPFLTDCANNAICNKLQTPEAIVNNQNNATFNCESNEAVMLACNSGESILA